MQESSYELAAKNKKCGLEETGQYETCVVTDYGIAQIHYKNLSRFNLDKYKLVSDLTYSVEAGAMILANYKRFKEREPDAWYARYNVGVRPLSKVKTKYLEYKANVERYM